METKTREHESQFYNEYVMEEYMYDNYEQAENDNHLVPFINLCLKHKQPFTLKTSSSGHIRIYYGYEGSEKKRSIDEALICLDNIIKQK